MNKEVIGSTDMRLADWRERGEDRLAPVRFYFIEALSRRASQQRGDVRRLLDERLSRQLQAYQDEVVEPARLSEQRERHSQEALAKHNPEGPLAELLAYVGGQTPSVRPGGSAASKVVWHKALSLEPALIDYFRNAWANASANGLLRQSQAQVPDNAGPLNSSSLAHRALLLMREQSPGYLHHFLSYMDALSWMEQLNEERTRTAAKPVAGARRKAAKRLA